MENHQLFLEVNKNYFPPSFILRTVSAVNPAWLKRMLFVLG